MSAYSSSLIYQNQEILPSINARAQHDFNILAAPTCPVPFNHTAHAVRKKLAFTKTTACYKNCCMLKTVMVHLMA